MNYKYSFLFMRNKAVNYQIYFFFKRKLCHVCILLYIDARLIFKDFLIINAAIVIPG